MQALQLYPFADSVAVFNARSLAFLRALAFWEVFPSTRHISQSVQCLTVENSMKLVRVGSAFERGIRLTSVRSSHPWAIVWSPGRCQELRTTIGACTLLCSYPKINMCPHSIASLVIIFFVLPARRMRLTPSRLARGRHTIYPVCVYSHPRE